MDSSEINDKPKIALILGDGAIRAGFVAGAAARLMELNPDLASRIVLVYGASASAGNAVYFAKFGERHPGQKMWTQLLADPHFITKQSLFSSEPVYDIDYMANVIFRQKTPLPDDMESVGVVFPTLELGTDNVTYFANAPARELIQKVKNGNLKKLEGRDIYNLIGAASAAPFVYDRSFEIDGDQMIDAAPLAPSIDDLVIRDKNIRYIYIFCRKNSGFFTILKYILNTSFFISFVLPFRRYKFPLKNYWQYALKPFQMRRAFRNALNKANFGQAVVIYPSEDLGKIDDNSEENLEKNYKLGVITAEKLAPEVRKLLDDR